MLLALEPWWPYAAAVAGGLLLGIGLTAIIAHGRGLRLRTELRVREEQLKHQEKLELERQAALDLAQERLGAAFGNLANEHLRSNTETFLRLARESLGAHHERAKGDLAAREQAVEGLVRPIRDALTRTESQIHELEKARREAYGGITAQLEAMGASQQALQAETRNLVSALRRPEVRGQWGEITLRRLVELAGMVEHCDFVEQSQQSTPDGPIRPDLIVSMPNQRQLVVDVKTPLDAYLDATQAADDASRRTALERHAAKVAERIRELSSKAYWSQFEHSPEFVILFIPGDQFLSAALSSRPYWIRPCASR
jgi:DNA recombination protein RmuC